MRIPLSWLRDYVDVDLAPERLAERLTLLGMEVKGLERWGADWQGVVVGELLSVERHPRADRLSLTRVRVGSGEELEIVCGATNIAPGQRVPVALPGAVLPGGRAIGQTEKMGVVSNGMLCSGDELRLTGDGEGILILPVDAPLGEALADLYGDMILDVDVKPNRGDALCLVGLAREVAAITGGPVRFPDASVTEAGAPIGEDLRVDVEDTALCSRFVGRLVRHVGVAASPDAVQMRLLAAGMRPVSNVVDATNYVMLELGKPTHAFDAAALAGGRIVVRRARAGERLETLDHVVRELDPETLLVADERGPLAIAGVMGGAASEVSGATTDVVVESAVFDPVSIRRTAFRYALRSEASLLFEKGQEPRLARIGADRVAALVAAWSGGAVAPGRVDTAPAEPVPARVAFRPARVNRLLGTTFSADEQRGLLDRVGIATEHAPAGSEVIVAAGTKPLAAAADPAETALFAVVPTWRHDLLIEADVAEEVARVRGYDAIRGTAPDTATPPFRPSPLEVRDAVRAALAGAGLAEVVTPALVGPDHDAQLRWPADAADGVPGCERTVGRPVVVRNPLSVQHSVMRTSLVGSLLDVLAANERHGRRDVRIFEVGKGYAAVDAGSTGEWWRLAFVLAGDIEEAAWNRPARAADLDDAKGLVELLCRVLGLSAPAFAPHRDGYPLHPGRAARAVVPGALAGLVGELHPEALATWDLRSERVLVAELAIEGLEAGSRAPARVVPIPRFPGVERDLAVVVAEDVAAGAVAATIEGAAGPEIRRVELFDVYRGIPLAAGEKSLACRLVFRAAERTLTEDEVERAVEAVVEAVRAAHGARIRT